MKKRVQNLVCAILFLMLITVVFASSYKPTPAPDPMGDFTLFAGETFYGEFVIEDPNGPAGLTVTSEPGGLTINEPVITVIDEYPDAKRYIYLFRYIATSTGTKNFTITSTDSLGVTVQQIIRFEVVGNDPQVFTGCYEVTEPNEPVSNTTFEEKVKWKYAMFERVALNWLEQDLSDQGIVIKGL